MSHAHVLKQTTVVKDFNCKQIGRNRLQIFQIEQIILELQRRKLKRRMRLETSHSELLCNITRGPPRGGCRGDSAPRPGNLCRRP